MAASGEVLGELIKAKENIKRKEAASTSTDDVESVQSVNAADFVIPTLEAVSTSINDVESVNVDFVAPILFTSSPISTEQFEIENYNLIEETHCNEDIESKAQLSGRRIVDINYFFKQIQESLHTRSFGCSFLNMDFVSEIHVGFLSKFKFKCRMCGIKTLILSEKTGEPTEHLPINEAAVNGTLSIGIGHSQLSEFTAAMEIPCMSNTTYSRVHGTVSFSVHNTAWDEMKKAGVEERELALEAGEVDENGIPISYKTKYDALSGVASIIGYRTKKVLFVGMEADGVVEGFMKSVEMHNLKFNKLIGDGDSSVTKRLLEVLPYGPNVLIEKIECRNHLLRNYSKKIATIAKKSCYPINLRKFIIQNAMRFRTGIVKAIRYQKNENKPLYLGKDIYNSPYHVLGQHTKCASYFCRGNTVLEQNLVIQAENCGMMLEIINAINRLVANSSSLITDYIGGKRINMSQRNAYNSRVEAAVIAFNSKEYLRAIHKNIMKKSPGMFGKSFLKNAKRQKLNNQRRRALFIRKKNRNKQLKTSGPDENYDLAEELPPESSYEDLTNMKLNFINEIKNMDREQLEKNTRDQAKSQLWYTERRKRLTASKFGKICKMRQNTSCKNTVHELLYGQTNHKIKAIEYGRVMESVAKVKFEELFNLKIKSVGLCIDVEVPYLAASPDGFIENNFIIEIKCPFSAKDNTSLEDAMNNEKADLVEMIPYSKKNKGYKYILCVIDCFTKFAWAIALKSKTAKEVSSAMSKILIKRKPKLLQLDNDMNVFGTSQASETKKNISNLEQIVKSFSVKLDKIEHLLEENQDFTKSQEQQNRHLQLKVEDIQEQLEKIETPLQYITDKLKNPKAQP
ncbi:hypothetical protein QTP88_015534 [Uroleucon formosanum]